MKPNTLIRGRANSIVRIRAGRVAMLSTQKDRAPRLTSGWPGLSPTSSNRRRRSGGECMDDVGSMAGWPRYPGDQGVAQVPRDAHLGYTDLPHGD